MITENTFDKLKLISELKEIHIELVEVYKKIFDYKYRTNADFEAFIDKEYKENKISDGEQQVWNDNFCHRASYTLLNKILFIRICEDKGFMLNPEDYVAGEPKDPHIGKKLSRIGLQKWANLVTNYTLGELVKLAFLDMKKSYGNIALYKDDKYEMLTPTTEELSLKYLDGDEEAQKLVLQFENALSNIVEKLDTNNYNFNNTDGNILGDVYEKFMDRVTRKAIGQFYTPEFVIEYILNNTVAKADVVENPFLSIADISCGSGHFLIMAYDILKEKFINNIELLRDKYSNEVYKIKKNGREEELTGREYWKEEHIHYHLLKHCIYGADIDSFAIQLTTINLLLKDLDNFTDELNIIECDSLIKWEEDYDWINLKQQLEEEFETIEYTQTNLIGEEEKITVTNKKEMYELIYNDILGVEKIERINREKAEEIVYLCEFWIKEFDYVVGNPPYIEVKKIKDILKPYLRNRYTHKNEELIKGRYDIYWAFFKRGIDLLKDSGSLAFITSVSYLDAVSGNNIRKYMLQNCKITEIIYNGKFADDVNVYTVITILNKSFKDDYMIQFNSIENNEFKNLFENKKSFYLQQPNQIIKLDNNNSVNMVLDNIEKGKEYFLDEVVYIQQGIILQNEEYKKENFIYNQYKKELKPYIEGKDVDKYFLPTKHRYVFYKPEIHHRARIPEVFTMPKLLIKRISNGVKACLDQDGYYYMDNTIFTVSLYKDLDYIKKKYKRQLRYEKSYSENSRKYTYEYLLGIVNSKCFDFYFNNKFNTISLDALKKMPIPKADAKYKSVVETNAINIQRNHSFIENKIYYLTDIIKDSDNILEDYYKFQDKIRSLSIENENLIIEIDLIVYHLYGLIAEEVVHIEVEEIEERIEFIKDCYDTFSRVRYDEFCINNYLPILIENLDFATFYSKYYDEKKSVSELAEQYQCSITTMYMLHKYYVDKFSVPNKYNKSDLYQAVYRLFNLMSIEILNSNNAYLNKDDLSVCLSKNIRNLDDIIGVLREDNITIRTNIIVEEAINTDVYTWNAFRKDKAKNKQNKTFIKYYDSKFYGLAEWSDEIHKNYFLDAIEEYTVNSPNEKKAKDILKLFKDLDIEDRQDYIEVIEEKIRKTFK